MRRVELKFLAAIFAWISLVGVSYGASGLAAGLASLPCSEIIERKDNAQVQDWINFWIKGFWTGQNWSNSKEAKPLKNLSDTSVKPAALKARVLAYCYENQSAVLMDIAIELFGRLPELPASVKFSRE